MAGSDQSSGLQISEDLPYQRRVWRIQTVAWLVVAAFLAAAAAGVFGGSGPLMASTRSAGGALEVDYDRFTRFGAPTFLEFELGEGGSTREVAVSRAWLGDYTIDSILPEPKSVSALPDRYVFTFETGASAEARLQVTPRAAGAHDAVVWGPGDSRVEFTQVVYP